MIDELDEIAPAFRMARDHWPDAPNLKVHYQDLVDTFEANGNSLLELTKSYIETVCETINNEMGKPFSETSSPTTTQLLTHTLDILGLRHERGASALGKFISGYNKLSDGISDLRNNEGTVAHGRDGFLDLISNHNTRVYLLSADSIIALLLNAYDGIEPNLLYTRENYSRYQRYNSKIDNYTSVEVEIDEEENTVELKYRVTASEDEEAEIRTTISQLLYYLDRQAYKDILEKLRGLPEVEADKTLKWLIDHLNQGV